LFLPFVSRGEVEVRIAAAATDRLRENAVAVVLQRFDRAEIIHVRRVAVARFPTRAANRELRGETGLRVVFPGETDADDEIHARIAAATANARRFDRMRADAVGRDLAGRHERGAAIHEHRSRMTATGTGAA